MSRRPFIFIIILLIIIFAVVIGFVLMGRSGSGPLAGMLSGNTGGESANTDGDRTSTDGLEPGEPTPTATPMLRLLPVIVAKTDLPVGEEIRRDLITVEERPETNIALQGSYTFTDEEIDDLIGQFARVNISKGQAILKPMVALSPNDLTSFGSDLSLYLDQGSVAVAFPLDKFSGAAYALRPGDVVDAMMTMSFIDIDPEFRTAFPNLISRVFEPDLLTGNQFLFPESLEGRLEFIDSISQVAEISPANPFADQLGSEDSVPRAIPRRMTQLTVQQAGVVWVGTWRGPLDEQQKEEDVVVDAVEEGSGGIDLGGLGGGDETAVSEEEAAAEAAAAEEAAAADAEATPLPVRLEETPDVVILSLSPQDALVLKWALDRGLDIDLVLRAQGETAGLFTTTSVSLPQIVDHSGWLIPEGGELDLSPHPEDAPIPFLEGVSIP